MSRTPKPEKQRWLVVSEPAADGTGDAIVPLPDDLLEEMKLSVGDKLSVEMQVDGTIKLTPIRR